MLQISQINIYPIKSLDGYSPISAMVEARGLEHDRRWMVVDADGQFFTQRFYPKMALLRATVLENYLVIEEKNNLNNSISVSIETMGAEKKVRVWDDTVMARLVSEEIDVFLSNFLETPCHLVKMPETSVRSVEEPYNTGDDEVSFADGYPFLIIGEASITDLNERLTIPLNVSEQPLIGMRRFRTNFVFSGGQPYEEETWSRFDIGKVAFQGVKPCGRCVMTTLDPDTGLGGKEPLATLASYRMKGKKIPFGQNVLWKKNEWRSLEKAIIKVGDTISLR
jgi:uncharacterized protein